MGGAPGYNDLNERRRQIREIVRYLIALRQLVQRAAGEHAKWVRFIAEAASLLRASPSPFRKADPEIARRYAETFGKYERFASQLPVPAYCVPLHRSLCTWLETLVSLSSSIGPAIEGANPAELDGLVRKAAEAQIRLHSFQRMHAKTIAGIKKLFQDRPGVVKKPTRSARAAVARAG